MAVIMDTPDSGYTKLPNDLFDATLALSSSLSKRELVVLLAVIRNTIGWHRLSARLSCRMISGATGIAYQHVNSALNALEKKGLVSISREKITNTVTLNRSAILSQGVTDLVTDGVTDSVTPDSHGVTDLVTVRVTDSVTGCNRFGDGSVTDLVTNKERKKDINKKTNTPLEEEDALAGLF